MSTQPGKLAQARMLYESGQSEKARSLLLRILQQHPSDADANIAMSIVLFGAGQVDQAVFYGRRAVQSRPNDVTALSNLGQFLTALGRADEAIPHLEKAVSLSPTSPNARLGIANALSFKSRFTESLEHCSAGLASNPLDPALSGAAVSALIELGRASEAVDLARAAASRWPDNPTIAGALCHSLNYPSDEPPDAVRAAHLGFGDLADRLASRLNPLRPADFSNPRDPSRILRIGILSPDLRTHSVAFFIEPFLAGHSRDEFDLICYHTSSEDRTTARLRSHVKSWKNVAALGDASLIETIRADRVDLLLELAGHTRSQSLVPLAARLAPVQVTYLGYPNTTGVRAIDFRIVDTRTDPPGSDALNVERLLRIDPCFLCYRPLADAPEVSPPPFEKDGFITFGSFNALAKVTDEVVRAWASVLSIVPGSRLAVKSSALADPLLPARLRDRLESLGVPGDRLDILIPTPGIAAHLDMYRRIDIGLDPFPYNGTTTTCEAMWMGVPVVSLAGPVHAARVGVSLLHSVGASELVAPSRQAYIETAAAIARDHDAIRRYRATLRETMRSSPLCDERAFVKRLESALRHAWRDSCGSGNVSTAPGAAA